MTEYIGQQLRKLCDRPDWFDDMLTQWVINPENLSQIIHDYLVHVQLNGLLINTKIVRVTTIIPYLEPKPGFYFELPGDPNIYLILGMLDEKGLPHCLLVHKIKLNSQLN